MQEIQNEMKIWGEIMRKRIVLSVLMLICIFTFMFILSKSNKDKLIKAELYTTDDKWRGIYGNNESTELFEKVINSANKKKGKIDYQKDSCYKVVLYYHDKKEVLYLCIGYRLKNLYFQYEKDKEHIYVIPENNSRELEGLILNRPR